MIESQLQFSIFLKANKGRVSPNTTEFQRGSECMPTELAKSVIYTLTGQLRFDEYIGHALPIETYPLKFKTENQSTPKTLNTASTGSE